jgi:hypothetical protein
MSWQNVKQTLPGVAASAVAMYAVLKRDLTVDNQYFTAGSVNDDAVGISLATVPTYGYAVPVAVEGVTKVLVIASSGAGARMSVGSTNGGVIPVIPSGLATSIGSALGVQGLRYSIGVLQEARAAGEYGSLFIDPREIV